MKKLTQNLELVFLKSNPLWIRKLVNFSTILFLLLWIQNSFAQVCTPSIDCSNVPEMFNCDDVITPTDLRTNVSFDDCGLPLTLNTDFVRTDYDGCADSGTRSVRFWLADATGMEVVACNKQITINPPTIVGNCPLGLNDIKCADSIPTVATAMALVEAAYSTTCGMIVIEQTGDTGPPNSDCNFSRTYSFSVSVSDGMPPSADCPSITCEVTYSGNDDIPPMGTCPTFTDLFPNLTDLQCVSDVPSAAEFRDAASAWVIYNFTDNCGGAVRRGGTDLDFDLSQSDCEFGGVFYFNVADECNNNLVNRCAVSFGGGDTTPPEFNDVSNVPPSLELVCGYDPINFDGAIASWISSVEAAILAVATDNCMGDVSVRNDYNGTAPDVVCADDFSGVAGKVVRFNIKDECDNEYDGFLSRTIKIIIKDPPVIVSCPAPTDLECFDMAKLMSIAEEGKQVLEPTIVITSTVTLAGVPVKTSCNSGYTVSYELPVFTSNCGGTEYLIKYIVKDDCDRTAECYQTVTLVNDGPMITDCPNDMVVECYEDIMAKAEMGKTQLEQQGVSVSCDLTYKVSYVISDKTDNCPGVKKYSVTYTVEDQCGRKDGCKQFFTIENEGPKIDICPAPMIVECYEDIADVAMKGKSQLEMGGVTTSCDLEYKVNYWISPKTDNCPGVDKYYVDYMVTDQCGREDVCRQYITIENDGPMFTHEPQTLKLECGEFSVSRDILPWIRSARGKASCDLRFKITNDFDVHSVLDKPCGPFGNNNPFYLRVTWTITDQCGRTDITYADIMIVDTKDPIVSQPTDRYISCSDPVSFNTPFAYDICDDNLDVSTSDSFSEESGCCSYTRTWTFTDDCGNSASASQTLHVIDDTAPTLTPVHPLLAGLKSGDELRMECDEAVTFIETDVVASDDCTNCDAGELTVKIGDQRFYADCKQDGYISKMECWWYAEDRCGNVGYFSIYIIIEDTKAPVFTYVPNNETIECGTTPSFGMATAEDACDETVDLTYKDQTIVNACETKYIRTWTAEDDCGNKGTASQTITQKDDTNPIFTYVPADENLSCGATPNFGTPTATDNCGTPTIAIIDQSSTGNACDGMTMTRTWSATDACGNSVTAMQTINVAADSHAPTFSNVPANKTIECGSTMPTGEPTVSDDCGIPTVTMSETSNGSTCPKIITRTWTALDDCGNENSISQVITIEDTTPPTVTCPSSMTLSCEDATLEAIDNWLAQATAYDNCSDNLSIMHTSATTLLDGLGNCGYIEVHFVATDDCGNQGECVATLTVVDNTTPVFTYVPADATIDCNDIPDPGTATATDNCGTVTVTHSDEDNMSECGGTFVRTWTAMDNCGNKSTASQTITRTADNEAPMFTYVPADATIDCNDIPDPGTATATDNCGTATVTHSDEDNMSECGGTFVRTWTAVDNCGNKSTASQTITRTADNEAPIFTSVPADATITCGDPIVLGMPTASDNCGDASDINITFTDEYNVDNINFDNCNNGFGYDIFRTWKATDKCGNMTTVIQSAWIVPEGYNGPVFDFTPPNTVLKCGDTNKFGEPVCVTACGDVRLTHEDFIEGEDCSTGVIHTRVWTAIDDCGNIATASQSLALPADIEAPIFNNMADRTVHCGESREFDIPICIDNCTVTEHLLITHQDVPSNDGCSITRNWTALDNCGNEAKASQTISFEDNVAPVFNFVPENKSITCGESFAFKAAEAIDACGNVSISFNDKTTEINGGIKLTRTWIATDGCGNETTASRSIEQVDKLAPSFTFVPANHTITCGEAFNFGVASAEDLCGNVLLNYVDKTNSTNCAQMLSVTRTWTALDDNGNESKASQTITQLDNEAPVFSNVLENLSLSCGETAEFTMALVSDACSQVELNFSDQVTEPTATQAKQVTRTWTAIDACGNVASARQTISYALDTQAPSFTFVPETQTLDCGAVTNFGTPEVIDNCSEVSISFKDVRNSGDCIYGYSFTRTWTAKDASGNEVKAAQVFNFTEDKNAPVFTFEPTDKVIACSETVEFGFAKAEDNCSDIALSSSDKVELVNNVEVHTRTWTATDACGNASEIKQSIYVVDDVAPVIVFSPENKSIDCGQALSFDHPVATDNCSELIVNFVDIEQALNDAKTTITREWTYTDESGNQTKARQTITMADNLSPVFDYVPAAKVFACGQSNEIGSPIVSDNCSEVSISFEDETISSDCSNGYQFRRVWTATDLAGNVAFASQEFSTELDNTVPTFTFIPEEFEINSNENFEFGTPSVTDNCSSVTLSFEDTERAETCGLVRTRTWTAVDQCGNVQQASQDVRMKDTEAPVFDMPTALNMTYAEFANWKMPSPTALDNLSEVSFSEITQTTNNACDNRSFSYSLNAVDACGNVSVHTTTVFITDAQPESEILEPTEIKFLKDNQFTTNVIKGLAPYSYNWNLVEGAHAGWEISSEANQTEISLLGGLGTAMLSVVITDANACTTNSTIKVENVVNDKDFFLLTPNPTRAYLELYFTVQASKESKVLIFDMLGRQLSEIDIDNFAGMNKHTIDASRFASGTYMLHLDTGENTYSEKFIKIQ